MILGLLWVARLLSLEPVEASIAGARLAGVPGLASELLDICEVESLCERVGIHAGRRPRVRGATFWRLAEGAGWLDPATCPLHCFPGDIPDDKSASAGRGKHAAAGPAISTSPAAPRNIPSDGARWGIRGTHGLAAAYSVRWLGPCVAPEAIDVPVLSAIVTARRLGELASRYGRRTAAARAEAWRRGVGATR